MKTVPSGNISLVPADTHLVLFVVLAATVALSVWLSHSWRSSRISPVLPILLIPLVLSNTGIIPMRAPVYDLVSKWFVVAAIPLMLLQADFRRIILETGQTLAAFLLAAGGTVLGVVVGFVLVPPSEHPAAVAGALAAAGVGGSMNFVAVSRVTGIDGAAWFPTLLAITTIVAIAYLMFLSVLPGTRWFRTFFAPARGIGAGEQSAPGALGSATSQAGPGWWHPRDMAVSLALSAAICAIGLGIASVLELQGYAILIITAVGLVAANAAPGLLARLQGNMELGTLLLFVFFATLGARTNLVALAGESLELFLFCGVAVAGHALTVFGIGRLLGFSGPVIAVASNACLLGPPTAAGLAASNGWTLLVAPAILCGILGYATANFLGVAVAGLLGGVL
jgi:uncharacterized membrane protein